MLTLFAVRFAWAGSVIARVAARDEDDARELVAGWLNVPAVTLVAVPPSRAR